MDNLSLYKENKDILDNHFGSEKDKFIESVKKIAFAKTNLKSIKAMVAKEKDNEKISKTALKDIIDGDKRSIEAEDLLEKWKGEKEIRKVSMGYLEMQINNNKKMMDSLTSDKKYMGT